MEQDSKASAAKVRRTNRHYAVVYEKAPRNFAAYVPDLPGCIATGKTRSEVERRIRTAIKLHVEELRRQQLPVPEPAAWADVVDIPA